jgi:hypothetical protein
MPTRISSAASRIPTLTASSAPIASRISLCWRFVTGQIAQRQIRNREAIALCRRDIRDGDRANFSPADRDWTDRRTALRRRRGVVLGAGFVAIPGGLAAGMSLA